MSAWTEDNWICEDCEAFGTDWGVPPTCPVCGSPNTAMAETNDDELKED